MTFGDVDSSGSKNHVLGGSAHWRNLANTIEPSMCGGGGGGDAAFLSNCIDHVFVYVSKEHGSLLAETVVRSGAVLISVGYDLCPHGTCSLPTTSVAE